MSTNLNIVKAALREDVGKKDITSASIIPKEKKVNAAIITRQACVVCGLDIAKAAFKTQDKMLEFSTRTRDGRHLKKGACLARIEGRAGSILAAERVALNFLSLLSGIATKTYEFVKAAQPYKVKILDTRKTVPGLRKLQKYAVRTGGGYNHRMGLNDMVLIKDNHIKVTKSQSHKVTSMIEEIRKKTGKKIKIEIEVKNLREFKQALRAGPDIIMLDNMKLTDIRKISSTGIDMISVVGLTHSIKSIDLSLEIL
jgi:nicotinate-nucleotide pyrophosphorylase (carboxylating)